MTATPPEAGLPAYWQPRRAGESLGAHALRITAAYLHDNAVTGLARALGRERQALALLRLSQSLHADEETRP